MNILTRLKTFLCKINHSRGQNLVEYGLLIALISIITIQVISDTERSTRDVIRHTLGYSYESNQIELQLPDSIKEWDEKESLTNPPPRPPVAFFTVTNPIYAGDKITYWDGSLDPDGDTLNYRWIGKRDTFPSSGQFTVTLIVTDSSGMSDSYSTTIYVEKRNPYTKKMTIHKDPDSIPVGSPSISNISSEKRIVDHQFDERSDLYGEKHIVIEENYVQTTTYRQLTQTYQVTVPLYNVTFDGYGNILNTSLHKNIVYSDTVTNPYPAMIQSKWEDNRWTFFVYNEYSSVRNNDGTGSNWGERSPSADYSRLDPDKLEDAKYITQYPTKYTSRDTYKLEKYAVGYTSPTTPCKTCTEPNRFVTKSQNQTDYRTVYGCGGRSYNKPTHTRTYNWIEHDAYDWIYRYTGVGDSNGNSPSGSRIYLNRGSWNTDGWESEEMVGTGTAKSPRPKYTNCDGNGWSESCWEPESNSSWAYDSWDNYYTYEWSEEREVECNCRIVEEELCGVDGAAIVGDTTTQLGKTCVKVEKEVCDTCTESRDCDHKYYKRKYWTCSWDGTTVTHNDYVWKYKDKESCTNWN